MNGRRGYAEIYGASAKDALVTARDPNVNKSAGMLVFLSSGAVSSNLETDTAQRSFTFVGEAYVAISVATGTWSLQPYVFDGVTLGSVLKLSDPWAPIAVQLGQKADYATFDAFKTAVKTKTTSVYEAASGKFTYTSLNGNVFVIRKYLGSVVPALPTVDGALTLNPALTYDSPYLSGTRGSDQVTLSFPGYASTILDFSK